MLELNQVSYRASRRWIIHHQTLAARSGELLALVGPNGAGKSTLMGLLSGRLTPRHGQVLLNGRSLTHWPLEALATHRSVLSQQVHLHFNFTASEVVALGLKQTTPSHKSNNIVYQALSTAQVIHLASQPYPSLSGGEQRQVQFARALAQIWQNRTSAWLLLDEPDAGLDIAHQDAILKQAKQLAVQGCGVIAVLHDLNLAARYADKIALIAKGEILMHGTPASVLRPHLLSDVYGIALERHFLSSSHYVIAPA